MMGFLENYLTGGLYGEALGSNMRGIPLHPQQLAAMQQQQAPFDPFEFQRQQARAMQAMMPYSTQPISKHVESKDITPRERARKQISGAVQAVKDAQLAAKS